MVTLAGSSFSWALSSSSTAPVSFYIRTQEEQDRDSPLSAGTAPASGTAAVSVRRANRNDRDFFI